MSITIFNKHKFFNNKKNILILFKDIDNLESYQIKEEGDFKFIFSNKKLVGINVFDFENYFKAKVGFHKTNIEIKEYLLKNFSTHVNENHFDPFFKIGNVIEIKVHPSSNKLRILTVNFKDGQKQIITNIQNIESNKNYLFATPGSITANGLQIGHSKIMNVQSEGMIMSYKSLGLDKNEIIDCSNMSINDEFDF